jgi:hypothetical protein
MEEAITWESASKDAPPVSEQVETPAVETPEVETTLAPELDAQTVPEVETSEQVSEEMPEVQVDDDPNDPPEVRTLSTKAAKEWARRQFKDAEPLRTFINYEKPISDFATDLFNRSKTRYSELVNDVTQNHPDYISKKLFGMPAEDVKARLATPSATPEPTTPQQLEQPLTTEQLDQLPWELSEQLRTFQETQAQREAELKTQNEDLKKRLEAIEGKFTTKEQQEQQARLDNQKAEALKIGNDLYESAWSVVAEGIKDSGLEIQKDDPPRIQNLKSAALDLLSKERIEAVFDEDEENRKLVSQVMAAASRMERDNAFREEDNLKVRARAAFEKAKSSPKVQEILNEIVSFNSKSQKKTVPSVPAPGSAGGMTIKPPKTWDEAVAAH